MATIKNTSFAYIIHSNARVEKVKLIHESDLAEDSFLWCHININEKNAYQWLLKKSKLDSQTLQMMIALTSRSKVLVSNKGILALFYAGLALDVALDEELVPISIWVEESRIITVSTALLQVNQTIIGNFLFENHFTGCVDFLQNFIRLIVDELYTRVERIESTMDDIEQTVDTSATYLYRSKIIDVRKQVIYLRRYLLPQKETVQRLCSMDLKGLTEIHHQQLKESGEQLIHQVEMLISIYERARVMQEELSNQLSEQLNQKMYLLSAITCVFLPLSFITGLLGINVDGIPGSHNKWAFLLVCISLVALGFITIMFFKRKKWL